MPHYVERKWVLIDPLIVVYTLETRVSLDTYLAVGREPCGLMLKRYPEVGVLKSSTTIAFGTERDPRVALVKVRHPCLS